METLVTVFVASGIPTAITGFLVWLFQFRIKAKEAEKERKAAELRAADEEKEKNMENLMVLIMQTCRATNVLAEATARAVQRIPDAHCNGDMTKALEQAAKIQQAEQKFLMDQGVKHIFGE